jgi:folate-binding protein YgfZ
MMNQNWHDFLTAQGARFADDGRVAAYGDPATEAMTAVSADVLCDLSHFGLIRAAGPDSVDFLQNQTGNDVRRVSDTQSQLSSYASPKGRMYAVFRLFRHGGDLYLRLPQELMEPVLKRLRMFVLMAKVKLEDAGDELGRFGVAGPVAAGELATALGVELPAAANGTVQADGVTVVRVPGNQRYEVYGPVEALTHLWRGLSAVAQPVGADGWRLLDILAGLPTVYAATSEAFIPQMANMQLVEGVSFRKGCYPGQEIVARMQYLGQLKRRTYLAHVTADARPQPGDELFSASSESGQGAGKVVDAAPSAEGGYELLAVMEIASAEKGGVRLGDANGPALRLRELPYGWDATDAPKAS